MSAPHGHDLLGGVPPTYLPEQAHTEASQAMADGVAPAVVAARSPAASLAWAVLAEQALERATAAGDDAGRTDGTVAAYAYARTGYHRGLDALRRAGWKGRGPVPWSHEPNRGYLRSVQALARAAELVGEQAEVARLRELLLDGDPTLA